MDHDTLQKFAVLAAGLTAICCLGAAAELLEKQPRKRKKIRNNCLENTRSESPNSGCNIQKLLKKPKLLGDAYQSIISMDENCFMEILSYVKNCIERTDTNMRKCIPVEEKLAVTLRFLTTGESFSELAVNTTLSLAYVSIAVSEVCSAIYRKMQPKFLEFPNTKEKWIEIANDFERDWNFPLCVGALAAKHIAMTPKKNRAHLFYNSKAFHSIILLAISDASSKFIFIDVGSNGSLSDKDVYSRSVISQILNSDNLLPSEQIIGNNRKLPHVIVADDSFEMKKHILSSYNHSNLNDDELIFNKRLNRAKHNVEKAFGMLFHRFQVFQKRIQLSEEKTKIIVEACCVLHNFLIHKSTWYTEGLEDIDLEIPNLNNNFITKDVDTVREQFKEYFCNEGNI